MPRQADENTMRTMQRLLAERLSERPRRTLNADLSIRCAVLVPLIAAGDGFSVLYTLRSEGLPSHKGQVAFPGGKRADADSSLAETALREAEEEVGIKPADVEIIGSLDEVYTLSAKFHVTPYVGIMPAGRRLRANPAEVSDIFSVTVEDLLDSSRHRTGKRSWGGNDYEVPMIRAGRHEIWGVTHSITMNFIECLREMGMG